MRLVAVPLVSAGLLFGPAGRLAWTRGWLFLVVWVTLFDAAALDLWWINPESFAARNSITLEGTKGWGRILLAVLFPVILAIFIVAALDDGRFQWSRMPWWGVGLGYLLLTTGVAITAWAQAVNRFFEPGVRIQTERGHHVVDTGPYGIIRHPGYAAACPLFAGIALSLGSWWALVPVGFAPLMLVLRTA
jgi:protein-S-isoprenylcysteine O-methyltransferase Ste14